MFRGGIEYFLRYNTFFAAVYIFVAWKNFEVRDSRRKKGPGRPRNREARLWRVVPDLKKHGVQVRTSGGNDYSLAITDQTGSAVRATGPTSPQSGASEEEIV